MVCLYLLIVLISLCAGIHGAFINSACTLGGSCVIKEVQHGVCQYSVLCPSLYEKDSTLSRTKANIPICCPTEDNQQSLNRLIRQADPRRNNRRNDRRRNKRRRNKNRRNRNRNRNRNRGNKEPEQGGSEQVKSPLIRFECGTRTKVSTGKSFPRTRRQIERKVVGGRDSQRNSWPWMALLGRKSGQKTDWFCDGALINEGWVLTAAHCIEDQQNFIVRLGEHDYSKSSDGPKPQDFEIEQKFPYPAYNPDQAYHDLALLKLSRKADLTNAVRPVCLPWDVQTNNDYIAQKVTLTGWGTKEFGGSLSPLLQEVDISVFSPSVCQTSYSELGDFSRLWPDGIKEINTLCAGDPEGGKDACQGDSGGPLVHNSNDKYTLVGVVSRGLGCGQAKFPGLYAPVSKADYLRWIERTAF